MCVDLEFAFFDPIIRQFGAHTTSVSIDECIAGANIVLCLTDHAMLQNLSLEYVLAHAARPLLIVDAWHNVQRGAVTVPGDVRIVQIGVGR